MYCNIESAPHRLDYEHSVLFTPAALEFLAKFFTRFDHQFEQLMLQRARRRIDLLEHKWQPTFHRNTIATTTDWTIDSIPERLQCRKLDLGDVSPANTTSFVDALYANVQGVQVDFDDGHCPTWRNTIQGLFNVTAAIHARLPGAPSDMKAAPILMLRPRAFNMIEHNCMVRTLI